MILELKEMHRGSPLLVQHFPSTPIDHPTHSQVLKQTETRHSILAINLLVLAADPAPFQAPLIALQHLQAVDHVPCS